MKHGRVAPGSGGDVEPVESAHQRFGVLVVAGPLAWEQPALVSQSAGRTEGFRDRQRSHERIEGRGQQEWLRAEPKVGAVVVDGEVVGGEGHDLAEGLCVEEDEAGCGAVFRVGSVLVVEHSAHECPAIAVIGVAAGSCGWDGVGQDESGQVAVVEEPAREPDSKFASCRQPSVEVGLGAVVDGPTTRSEVGEESLSGSDLLPAAVGDGWAELAATVGLGSGDDVPAGVPTEDLPLLGVCDFVDDGGREASKSSGLLVPLG